jgi:hypothetical protein
MSNHNPDMGNKRLIQLAEILEAADENHASRGEPLYEQQIYTHPCGTPACALGHWAAANPQSWAFSSGAPYGLTTGSRWNQCAIDFHLGLDEIDELFGMFGCGLPSTSKEAASYIRGFVSRRMARGVQS